VPWMVALGALGLCVAGLWALRVRGAS
jgi:hypothetical protein